MASTTPSELGASTARTTAPTIEGSSEPCAPIVRVGAFSHFKPLSLALDKPPKGLKSDPDCTLFVGRINHDTTEGVDL